MIRIEPNWRRLRSAPSHIDGYPLHGSESGQQAAEQAELVGPSPEDPGRSE